MLGEVDEYFIEQLRPGDAFVLRRRGAALRRPERDRGLRHPRQRAAIPIIPSYDGGKFPLSTHLAERVRAMLADRARVGAAAAAGRRMARAAAASARSFPARDEVLVETFARGSCHYLVAYPFEGRLAHQTLGMLLTRRLDRAGAKPARLRRQRLRLARVGPRRHLGADRRRQARPRRAVRRGHARRRPRRLARRDRA